MEWQRELGGQIAHELGVGEGGFASNSMLDVDHAQLEIPAGREFMQRMQQEHGIGAAGHGNPTRWPVSNMAWRAMKSATRSSIRSHNNRRSVEIA